MSTSRNPAKSRPLSANVKRLMRLARASPQNNQVIKVARQFTARDLAYCHTPSIQQQHPLHEGAGNHPAGAQGQPPEVL